MFYRDNLQGPRRAYAFEWAVSDAGSSYSHREEAGGAAVGGTFTQTEPDRSKLVTYTVGPATGFRVPLSPCHASTSQYFIFCRQTRGGLSEDEDCLVLDLYGFRKKIIQQKQVRETQLAS